MTGVEFAYHVLFGSRRDVEAEPLRWVRNGGDLLYGRGRVVMSKT